MDLAIQLRLCPQLCRLKLVCCTVDLSLLRDVIVSRLGVQALTSVRLDSETDGGAVEETVGRVRLEWDLGSESEFGEEGGSEDGGWVEELFG